MLFGVIAITPDSLLVRLMQLEGGEDAARGRRRGLTTAMSFSTRRAFAAQAAGVSEAEAGAAILQEQNRKFSPGGHRIAERISTRA